MSARDGVGGDVSQGWCQRGYSGTTVGYSGEYSKNQGFSGEYSQNQGFSGGYRATVGIQWWLPGHSGDTVGLQCRDTARTHTTGTHLATHRPRTPYHRVPTTRHDGSHGVTVPGAVLRWHQCPEKNVSFRENDALGVLRKTIVSCIPGNTGHAWYDCTRSPGPTLP